MKATLREVPTLDDATLRRFWSKVDRRGPDECWLWTDKLRYDGYGRFSANRVWGQRLMRAHRLSFALANGYLPPDATDHLCRNKACVNPAHLDAVPNSENSRRFANSMTACRRGHPRTADNVHIELRAGKGPARRCRRCHGDRARRRNRVRRNWPESALDLPPMPRQISPIGYHGAIYHPVKGGWSWRMPDHNGERKRAEEPNQNEGATVATYPHDQA